MTVFNEAALMQIILNVDNRKQQICLASIRHLRGRSSEGNSELFDGEVSHISDKLRCGSLIVACRLQFQSRSADD